MGLDRQGDDQERQENEHHVDQRRGVHFHHYLAFAAGITDIH
jgi:hypothetical protein